MTPEEFEALKTEFFEARDSLEAALKDVSLTSEQKTFLAGAIDLGYSIARMDAMEKQTPDFNKINNIADVAADFGAAAYALESAERKTQQASQYATPLFNHVKKSIEKKDTP